MHPYHPLSIYLEVTSRYIRVRLSLWRHLFTAEPPVYQRNQRRYHVKRATAVVSCLHIWYVHPLWPLSTQMMVWNPFHRWRHLYSIFNYLQENPQFNTDSETHGFLNGPPKTDVNKTFCGMVTGIENLKCLKKKTWASATLSMLQPSK
jgi:hypothetical protein